MTLQPLLFVCIIQIIIIDICIEGNTACSGVKLDSTAIQVRLASAYVYHHRGWTSVVSNERYDDLR